MFTSILKTPYPVLLTLFIGVLTLPCQASDVSTDTPAANVFELNSSLRQLQGSARPIELRGADARSTLSLPIPARLEIHGAELDLRYTNSISLLPRSQLAVSLDERILAQLPLRAEQPDNNARLRLPVERLPSGYHNLGFRAAQHYTNQCEDGSAPELLSQIDVENSALRLWASRRPVTPSLARLNEIFDPRLWLRHFPLSVVSASPDLLQAENLAVQGVALRLDFIPPHVEYLPLNRGAQANESAGGVFRREPVSRLAHSDFLLIGTREQLAEVLSAQALDKIQGAYLGVYRLDSDPSRAVIVLSGLTQSEVEQAARLFALESIALPDRQDIQIAHLDIPKSYNRLIGNPTQNGVDENGWISFSRLDFSSTTLKGMYPRPAELSFHAFSEMFDPRERTLEAQINLAYGAGFDKKSALNILLNGQFIQAIHLDKPHGDQLWRVKVNIPIAQLLAGRNVLSFAPSMIGQDVGGECRPIFTENLYLSIMDDSRIALPSGGGFLRLPDLSLLARTALPYAKPGDGSGSALLVAGDDDATHGAALTLLGKLAQVNKMALTGLRAAASMDALGSAENLLIVGDPEQLPAALRHEILTFMPKLHWQTLALGTQTRAAAPNLQNILSNPSQNPFSTQQSVVVSAELQLNNDLGQSAAVVQLQSASAGGTLTLFSASNAQNLQTAMQTLVGFDTWGALNGNGMLWGMDGQPLAFSFPVRHHFVGEISPTTRTSLILTERPALLIGLALGIILLTSLVTWLALRRRARRLKLE